MGKTPYSLRNHSRLLAGSRNGGIPTKSNDIEDPVSFRKFSGKSTATQTEVTGPIKSKKRREGRPKRISMGKRKRLAQRLVMILAVLLGRHWRSLRRNRRAKSLKGGQADLRLSGDSKGEQIRARRWLGFVPGWKYNGGIKHSPKAGTSPGGPRRQKSKASSPKKKPANELAESL